MKKQITIYTAVLFAATMFTSCSSIQSDAQKVADLQCKAQALIQKSMSGDMSVMQESQKLTQEATELGNQMKDKYKTESEQKEFADAVMKAMGKCK